MEIQRGKKPTSLKVNVTEVLRFTFNITEKGLSVYITNTRAARTGSLILKTKNEVTRYCWRKSTRSAIPTVPYRVQTELYVKNYFQEAAEEPLLGPALTTQGRVRVSH